MRKSATTLLPRSSSTNFSSIDRPHSSLPTARLPHSTSQHDCRKLVVNPATRARMLVATSATTKELARLEPVLNHDTDALKIGDRVFVNGLWSGIVLYIGETTLGKGDWAGVILDDPSLGRTNGIVRGRCYFQTTNNRGIFCRLTKLTRTALLSGENKGK